MNGFRGDYMGFTYNGIHSSELGIVRVSDGSRFNENLLPTMQDKTVQVPGGDGTYYFGSYYTQRQFNVSFAFDSLTEERLENLRRCFGDKKIHDLIFDETPYKVYSAKVTGTATLKYIPFSEGTTNRVYKGEGTVQFTCYQPFARSRFKWLDQPYEKIALTKESYKKSKYYFLNEGTYTLSTGEYDSSLTYYQRVEFTNLGEWKAASGLLDTQQYEEGEFYDKVRYNSKNSDVIKLRNPGVKESNFKFKVYFNEKGLIPTGYIGIWDYDKSTIKEGYQLDWSEMKKIGTDYYIIFDSKNNLIEGYDKSNKKTGNVYNQYITSGDFFHVPQVWATFIISKSIFNLPDNHSLNNSIEPIEYDYYYF